MEIIQIQSTKEIPKGFLWRCYTAEPSVLSAVASDHEKYGSEPDFVYQKLLPSGRSSVYIPVPAERFLE